MQANLSNSYRFVPILDFFDYEYTATPPTSTALALEFADRFNNIISTLDKRDSARLYDQLLYIAKITNYPCKGDCKSKYDIIISEDDYRISDYLLSITIDKSTVPAYSRAVVLTWIWLLEGQQIALSTYYKEYRN